MMTMTIYEGLGHDGKYICDRRGHYQTEEHHQSQPVTVMTLPISHSNANSNPKLLGSEILSQSVLAILPDYHSVISQYYPRHHCIVNTKPLHFDNRHNTPGL